MISIGAEKPNSSLLVELSDSVGPSAGPDPWKRIVKHAAACCGTHCWKHHMSKCRHQTLADHGRFQKSFQCWKHPINWLIDQPYVFANPSASRGLLFFLYLLAASLSSRFVSNDLLLPLFARFKSIPIQHMRCHYYLHTIKNRSNCFDCTKFCEVEDHKRLKINRSMIYTQYVICCTFEAVLPLWLFCRCTLLAVLMCLWFLGSWKLNLFSTSLATTFASTAPRAAIP
jgi:hypothetical protein